MSPQSRARGHKCVATFAARNEYPGFSFRSPGCRTSSDSFSSHGCDSPCIGPMLIETHRPSMKHATIQFSNPLTSVVLITWPSRAFPSICCREKSSLRPQGSVGRMSQYRIIWMYFERQSTKRFRSLGKFLLLFFWSVTASAWLSFNLWWCYAISGRHQSQRYGWMRYYRVGRSPKFSVCLFFLSFLLRGCPLTKNLDWIVQREDNIMVD